MGLVKETIGRELGSRKSPENQFTSNMHPAYKRSRSLSPPKDELVPLNGNTIEDVKVYMGSGPMPKYSNESAFPKAN